MSIDVDLIRRKRRHANAVFILGSALITGLLCCTDQPTRITTPAVFEPTGVLTGHTACKKFDNMPAAPAYSPSEDCIGYAYRIHRITSTDTLYAMDFTHFNACFNCCPDQILSQIEIGDTMIQITEADLEQYCSCLCLYDVLYQFEDIELPIRIRIIEPYLHESRKKLEFVLVPGPIATGDTLTGDTCLVRHTYPWSY